MRHISSVFGDVTRRRSTVYQMGLYRPKYYLTISTILVFTPIVLRDCWTKNYESYRKVYSRCLKLNKKKSTKISQTFLELLRFTWINLRRLRINAGGRQAPDMVMFRRSPIRNRKCQDDADSFFERGIFYKVAFSGIFFDALRIFFFFRDR